MQNFRIDAHYGCWFCGSMLFFVCIILTSRTLRSGGIIMRCTSCGAELPEGTTFCTSCGAKVENAQPIQPAYDQNFQNQSYQSQNYQNQSFQQPGGTYTGRSSRSSASGSGAPGTRLYTVMIKGRSSCRQRTYSSAREYTAARPARRTRSPSTRQYTTPPRGDA